MKTIIEAPIIHHCGEMWPRNPENIEKVLGSKAGGQGIYILFAGALSFGLSGRSTVNGKPEPANANLIF